METKTCSKCKEEKTIDFFPKGKLVCKACRKILNKALYEKNKDKYLATQKKWRQENHDKYIASLNTWQSNNADHHRQVCREYYQNNKDSVKEKVKEYKSQHKEHCREYHREYMKNYNKARSSEDIQFRLASQLRKRLSEAVAGKTKSGSAVKDLGCSMEELRVYLESKFQEGMSWGNYGIHGWHIDHILPLISFDLSDPEQLKVACHYSNLQPLWAKDNLSKGARMPEGPNPL